ncbi:MAG TPA: aminoglycoside phosphotransferase family protein [Acidimicrobiia bacterium]
MNDAAPTVLLTDLLGRRVHDVEPAPRQGAWTETYFFRDGGRELVIRLGDTAWNFEKDRRFAEYASADLPIPRVLAIGEVGDGRYYAVSERAHGVFLEALGGDALRRALPSVFRMLDAMRVCNLSGTTGFGSPLPTFDGEHRTWRAFLLSVAEDQPALDENPVRGWRAPLETRPDAARTFDDGYARLTSWVDRCPEARHVLHGDLLYGNVLVDGARVSAIFDWQCATYGDFLHDVAWLTFWAPWYPALEAADVRTAIRQHYEEIGLVVPDLEERVRCYELHIGLAHFGYHAWRGEWDHLDRVARRTREVLAGPDGS